MDIMESIVAKPLFYPFGIPVRNSVIATWIMMVMLLVAVAVLRRRVPVVLEMLVDFVDELAAGFIPGDTSPYIPFLGALLVFIATANLIGIVPMMFTPTRDVNTPVALALVVLFSSFAFGIQRRGLWGFTKNLLSPMLPFDIIGWISRTTSLSLRLFGNVVGGEVVVAVLFALIPVALPVVMVALTSITGLLQAYVFAVLAASHIASAIE